MCKEIMGPDEEEGALNIKESNVQRLTSTLHLLRVHYSLFPPLYCELILTSELAIVPRGGWTSDTYCWDYGQLLTMEHSQV